MKYELKNIGRNKFNGIVDVKDEKALLREVKKHLLSQGVELQTENEGDTYTIYAGIRAVGVAQRYFDEPAQVIPFARAS